MLRNKVSLHFKEATSVNDTASVQRFFKLFPMLNMHEYGLEQFSAFMRKTLKNTVNEKLTAIRGSSVKERRNVTIFADVTTFLFEEIAKMIMEYKPLVETYYGTNYSNLDSIINLKSISFKHHILVVGGMEHFHPGIQFPWMRDINSFLLILVKTGLISNYRFEYVNQNHVRPAKGMRYPVRNNCARIQKPT